MKAVHYYKPFLLAAVLSAIGFVAEVGIGRLLHKTYYDFLIWNLFLAWIPFLFSMAISELNARTDRRHPFLLGGLGIGWLLFFPNAPYIITDLIHLTVLKNNYVKNGIFNFIYWTDMLLIVLFAWIGLLLGAMSTYLVHSVIRGRAGRLAGWLFIAATSLLGGYGILLGREYRLNSWDVLSDGKQILGVLVHSLNPQAGWFCLWFGLVIAIVYVTFYSLINMDRTEKGA